MANNAITFANTPLGDYMNAVGNDPDVSERSPNKLWLIQSVIMAILSSWSAVFTSALIHIHSHVASIFTPSITLSEFEAFSESFQFNIVSSRLIDEQAMRRFQLDDEKNGKSSPVFATPDMKALSETSLFPIRPVITAVSVLVAILAAFPQLGLLERISLVVLILFSLTIYLQRAAQLYTVRSVWIATLKQLQLLISFCQEFDEDVQRGFRLITQTQTASHGYRGVTAVPIWRIETNSENRAFPKRFPNLRRLLHGFVSAADEIHSRAFKNIQPLCAPELFDTLLDMASLSPSSQSKEDARRLSSLHNSLDDTSGQFLQESVFSETSDHAEFSIASLRHSIILMNGFRRRLFFAMMSLQCLARSFFLSTPPAQQLGDLEKINAFLSTLCQELNNLDQRIKTTVKIEERLDYLHHSGIENHIEEAIENQLLKLIRKLGTIRQEWHSVEGKLFVLQDDAICAAKYVSSSSRISSPSLRRPLLHQFSDIEEDFEFLTGALSQAKSTLIEFKRLMEDGDKEIRSPQVHSSAQYSVNHTQSESVSSNSTLSVNQEGDQDEDITIPPTHVVMSDEDLDLGLFKSCDAERVLEGIADSGDDRKSGHGLDEIVSRRESLELRREHAIGTQRLMTELQNVLDARRPNNKRASWAQPLKDSIDRMAMSHRNGKEQYSGTRLDGAHTRAKSLAEDFFRRPQMPYQRRLIDLKLPKMIPKDDGMVSSYGEKDETIEDDKIPQTQ